MGEHIKQKIGGDVLHTPFVYVSSRQLSCHSLAHAGLVSNNNKTSNTKSRVERHPIMGREIKSTALLNQPNSAPLFLFLYRHRSYHDTRYYSMLSFACCQTKCNSMPSI